MFECREIIPPTLDERTCDMSKKKSSVRKLSKLHEITFRVFKIPKNLKDQVRTAREKSGTRNQDLISSACDTHLQKLVSELHALGLRSPKGPIQSVRWPFTDELLKQLRAASAITHVPANTLLQICLSRFAETQSQNTTGQKKRRTEPKGSRKQKRGKHERTTRRSKAKS